MHASVRLAGAVVLTVLAASPGLRAQDGWQEFKTAHYQIRTDADLAKVKELGDHLDAAYNTFTALFEAFDKNTPRSLVVVYATEEEYRKVAPDATSSAHYDSGTRELTGHISCRDILSTMTHEAVHQFHHIFFGRGYAEGPMPKWMDEGMADCLANGRVRAKRYYACVQDGEVTKMRLACAVEMIKGDKGGKGFTLEDVLRLDRKEFSELTYKAYSLTWSLCHFLLCYPQKGDPSKVIPKGSYTHVVVRLYNDLREYFKTKVLIAGNRRFASLDDVYRHAFQTKDNKPIDLKELNTQWTKYVTEFDVPVEKADPKKADPQKADPDIEGRFENCLALLREKKWSDLKKAVEGIRSGAADTAFFRENSSDIDAMREIAERGLKGKPTSYEVPLFKGTEADLKENWETTGGEGQSAWKVENGMLVAQTKQATVMSRKRTRLEWSCTAVFKAEASSAPGYRIYLVARVDKPGAAPTSKMGFVYFPDTGWLAWCSDVSGARPADRKIEQSGQEWNSVTLQLEDGKIIGLFNGQEVFRRELEQDEKIQGGWALQVNSGRVVFKSVKVTLK